MKKVIFQILNILAIATTTLLLLLTERCANL